MLAVSSTCLISEMSVPAAEDALVLNVLAAQREVHLRSITAYFVECAPFEATEAPQDLRGPSFSANTDEPLFGPRESPSPFDVLAVANKTSIWCGPVASVSEQQFDRELSRARTTDCVKVVLPCLA